MAKIWLIAFLAAKALGGFALLFFDGLKRIEQAAENVGEQRNKIGGHGVHGAEQLTKELFLRHGFRIVYDKDQDEAVSDGFFYTVGYGDLTSSELLSELLLYGICAISLTTTGSRQPGIRVCVSQLNRPEQFDLLEARLTAFGQNHR